MPLSLIIKTLTCVSCEFDFKIVSIFFKYLKFRKWFKYGLKAQKLLAQGIALGYSGFYEYALKGQKLYKQLKLEII